MSLRWRMLAFALALALTACGRVGFDPLLARDVPDGGAVGDGLGATGCTAPGDGDPFDGTSPCAQWGTPFAQTATLTQGNGQLTVALSTTPGTAGGCRRDLVTIGAAGAFAEVSQVVTATAATAQTRLVVTATGTSAKFQLAVTGGQIFATSPMGGVTTTSGFLTDTYDPIAMRWWRIRGSGNFTLYETSPDSRVWSIFAMAPAQPPVQAAIELSASNPNGSNPPGSAVFEGVNVCAP